MIILKSIDYGTSEGSGTIHDLDRFTSLGTMLSCTVYGAHIAVYLVALKYMILTSSLLTPQNRLWLSLSTLLFLCATASIALQIRWSWDMERMLEGSGSPFNIARFILFMTINWVSDSVLLFRFYAITGRRLTTMMLPLVMAMSSIVVSSIYYGEIAAAYTNPWSGAPNTPIIVYLSLSCGLNVYLTTHIVLYMARVTRTISKSRVLCNRIASMFIQSALFYLVPTLIFIALCAGRSLGQNLLFPIICQIQPLSPLLVIMRVAQSRLLNKEGGVVTTDDILSGSTPRRPRLSLKLDFGSPNASDLEGGAMRLQTPMAPTTSRLPEPLPFVKIRSDPPSAIEMLDSEKMDGFWKAQGLRRAESQLTSPSSATPSYLPSYRSSGDDLRIDGFPLPDPLNFVNASNGHTHLTPASSPSDTPYSPFNLSNPHV